MAGLHDARRETRTYRAGPLLVASLLTLLAARPTVLNPVADAYLAVCERLVARTPFDYELPPLAVALVLLLLAPLLVGGIALTGQQFTGQRALERLLASRIVPPGGAVSDIMVALGTRRTIICTTDPRVYAFTTGLVRPRIFLSGGLAQLLAADELEAVVRHELAHVARRDPLRFLLVGLTRPFWPLLPALRVLDCQVRLRAELAADRAAVAVLGREPLAAALIAVTHAGPLGEFRAIVASFSTTDARVAALLGRPLRVGISRSELTISLVSAVGMAALGVWLAAQPFGLPAICNRALV